MKKTFVDLTYFTFFSKTRKEVINTCYSTLGFLHKLNQDFSVSFVVRTQNEFENIENENLKLIFYKGNRLKKWQIPFQFNAFISSLKPDYILVHGFGYAHYLCFLKLINKKTKIVLQCNGFAPKPKGLKRWVYQISDNFIDGYLFTGIENSKHWYDSKIIKKEKIFEVMEGSTHFKFAGNSNRIKNSYLWVGNLITRKDPLTVLKGFNDFLDSQPLAKLTMIYNEDDLLAEVSEFISNNQKLKTAVTLKGFVPHTHLEELYHQHQYFVLGSLHEGSGYALVEAMACGCVPIVTSIPPFQFMTNNGNCAFLFEPKNSEALVHQLKVSQTCNYEETQGKVLQHFNDKLSFEAIATDIKSIFSNL